MVKIGASVLWLVLLVAGVPLSSASSMCPRRACGRRAPSVVRLEAGIRMDDDFLNFTDEAVLMDNEFMRDPVMLVDSSANVGDVIPRAIFDRTTATKLVKHPLTSLPIKSKLRLRVPEARAHWSKYKTGNEKYSWQHWIDAWKEEAVKRGGVDTSDSFVEAFEVVIDFDELRHTIMKNDADRFQVAAMGADIIIRKAPAGARTRYESSHVINPIHHERDMVPLYHMFHRDNEDLVFAEFGFLKGGVNVYFHTWSGKWTSENVGADMELWEIGLFAFRCFGRV